MVRTKADPSGVKASGGKAPRKTSLTTSGGRSGGRESKAKQYSGGNPYCPRETPAWQKQITTFFTPKPEETEETEETDSHGTSSHASEGPSQQEDSD